MPNLPQTHYDHFRRENGGAFEFLARDLKRLRTNPQLRVEDILPPKSQCSEDGYLKTVLPSLSIRAGGDERVGRSLLEYVVREYRFVLGYERWERTTYFMTEGLCDALTYTQLNVPCEDFRLPVECCMFVYANDVARDALHAFMKSPTLPGTTISVYVRDDNIDEIGFRRLLISVAETDPGGQTRAAVARQLALKPGTDLETALRTDWDKIAMPNRPPAPPLSSLHVGEDGAYETSDGDSVERFFEEGMAFMRLVVNSIMYVTSPDAELVSRQDGQVPRRIEEVDAADRVRRYSEVGPSVAGVPVIIEPGDPVPAGAPVHSGRRLKVRFLVPGKYRRPPNSPPDAKKTVWVRPHLRGPDMAELVHRPYIVR